MYYRYMTDISVWPWSLTSAIEPEGLPVYANVDVLVIGAGASGVAAATVASEGGASVLVVEKYGFAGGAAVAGMSGTICGLFMASDDPKAPPQQLVRGFSERFAGELRARGGLTAPQRYGKTFTVAHDPLKWRESADHLLTQAGVRVLYHTRLVDVLVENGEYRGAILASNAGMAVVRAQRVIDASGDGAVVARGGGATRFGKDGRIQTPTMFFRIGNVDEARFWEAWGADTICPAWVSEALVAAADDGKTLPRKKIWAFETGRPGELLVNATRITGENDRLLNVIDPDDFTYAEIAGREQVRNYAAFFREYVSGCSESHVVDTGVEAGIRQTRTVQGIRTLTDENVVGAHKAEDSICRSAWPIELHEGERPKLHWIIDDYYDVPYGTLVPASGEGIIVAGRCLSAEHQALASARVTAQCFEYGKAAAIATLASLNDGIRYRDIDGRVIAQQMIATGSSL